MTKAQSIKTISALVDAELAPMSQADQLARVTERYALAITPSVAAMIDRADEQDPIALQFVPKIDELNVLEQERDDPIGDEAHSPVSGIVHRYPDRVLLKAVHVCPVYCRFCFRREMVGPEGNGTLTQDEIDTALHYIETHSEIWEVILTGGDPLIMSPRRLKALMLGLAKIEHVKIIRFHTRVPVVDPTKINLELVEALKASGKSTYVALHANHANEFTPEAKAACAALVEAGIVMISQTVLLKGINNSVEALSALMRSFVENRIKPYYLHHPDLAPGTSHFRISIPEGQELVRQLRGNISGLCQPTYILDIPGGFGKAQLSESALSTDEQGNSQVSDFRGRIHSYADNLCGFTPRNAE